MIDTQKITAAKVEQKLSGKNNGDIVRPDLDEFETYLKSIQHKANYDTLRRCYEIKHTDDFGKLYFAKHHLTKILRKLQTHLQCATAQTPKIVTGGNRMNDVRYMSEITDDVDSRIFPTIQALSNFTIPPSNSLSEYQSIVHAYNRTVLDIKLSTPKGAGYYKSTFEALLPEYVFLLKNLVRFVEKMLIDYQLK
jgi:hypothetical protein